jgi:hypothetical protein
MLNTKFIAPHIILEYFYARMKIYSKKIFSWLMLGVICTSTFGLVHIQHFCKIAQQHSVPNIVYSSCDNKGSEPCCCERSSLPANNKKDNCCDNKFSFFQLHYQAIVIASNFHIQPQPAYLHQNVSYAFDFCSNVHNLFVTIILQPHLILNENSRALLCVWNT